MRWGGEPITRMAVLPAPTPKNVRPGARALMVAIPAAFTGAGRVPETATPVPMLMREVHGEQCWGASCMASSVEVRAARRAVLMRDMHGEQC